MPARRPWPEPSLLAGHRPGAICLCRGAACRPRSSRSATPAWRTRRSFSPPATAWRFTPSRQLEPAQAFAALRDFLVTRHDYRDPLTDEIYTLSEPHSLYHLFKVASGLDSMVLGETEILGQLKKAYDLALQGGHTGGRLNKAFQRAFNVAKHIRTETNIQRGSVSVGSVAVELAEKIFSRLSDRDVMILGAGDTGEKTARALLSRGARSILVSNRSPEKAIALANELGGRAVPFEDWAGEFANIDILITSTSAPHYLLDRARLEPRDEAAPPPPAAAH